MSTFFTFVFLQAKPNKAWCAKEPQTNKSEVFQKVANGNASDEQSIDNGPVVASSKPKSIDVKKGETFPPKSSRVSFQVVDLNENFRPELMHVEGEVVNVDSKNDVVQIAVLQSKDIDLNGHALSRRASILHDAMNYGSETTEQLDSSVIDEQIPRKTEVKEYVISQLSDVKHILTN